MRYQSPGKIRTTRKQSLDAAGIVLNPDSAITARAPDVDELASELSKSHGKLDFAKMFANNNPVELEVGVGKGNFLLARAIRRPEMNFIGVEYARQYCIYSADRFRRAGLMNVKMIHAEAETVFRTLIPDESLWRVHVYFPDPWPKRRHNRRRLITESFISQIRKTLKPGGHMLIVTDHPDYAVQIQNVLASPQGFVRTPFERALEEEKSMLVGTNFERKYRREGKRFFKFSLMRH